MLECGKAAAGLSIDVRLFRRNAAGPDRPVPPDEIRARVRRTVLGKPYVAGCPLFGIAHSDSFAGYVVASRKYVGLDVEDRHRPGLADLASRLHARISPADAVRPQFIHAWVIKESVLKAIGVGMFRRMSEVRLQRQANEPSHADCLTYLASIREMSFACHVFDFPDVVFAVAHKASYGAPALTVSVDGEQVCETTAS